MRSSYALLLTALALAQVAHAQQPFLKYGVKVKVVTLSNGRYPEYFGHDSLRRIGSVVYNTRLHRVAYLLPADSLRGRTRPEVSSRWMSPDPLAEKFLYSSPYVFAENNAVRYNDPDGRAGNDVILSGPKRQEAFQQLQASVKGTLNLSMDNKTGNVTYKTVPGAKQNDDAAQLTTAIDDHSIKVNVNANENKYGPNGGVTPVSAFLGNTVTPRTSPGGEATVVTRQQLNPIVSGKIDNAYNRPGATTMHEVVESYLGGKISQFLGISAGDAIESKAIYDAAHQAAPTQGGRIGVDSYDRNGELINKFDPKGHADIFVGEGAKKVIVQTYP